MAQMRTELGLVLKHVTGGAEKINAVNYMAKPPPLNDECYYAEETYAVNEQPEGFEPTAQGSNQENWSQVQGNQGRIYGNYNREGHYVQDGNYNCNNNFNRVTMVTEMIGMGPMSLLKIGKLLLGMVEIVCRELRICCTK